MGLTISVGILADLAENNPEMVGEFEKQFDLINEVLISHGLPLHREPKNLSPWSDPLGLCGFPYSWIHYLRRYQAHILHAPNKTPPQLSPNQKATDDPILDQKSDGKSHLIWHSDCQGFYVPVDFPVVIENENLPGTMLGSSPQLIEELRGLAVPLGFKLENNCVAESQIQSLNDAQAEDQPWFVEKTTWLMLFEAAKYSVQNKAAICFG